MVQAHQTIPDEHLVAVYNWIDEISFSRRRRKNGISRDFSDGVLCAELIAKFLPRLVELHNYTPSCSSRQKTTNWDTLNRKVLSKLGIIISTPIVRKLVESRPGTIEQVLWDLKKRVEDAVLHNPNICPITPISIASAISTSCVLRPPSARIIIGETQIPIRRVSAPLSVVKNGPKREDVTSSSRLTVEFQQPPKPGQQQQQQMQMPSSIPIPVNLSASPSSSAQSQNQHLHGQQMQMPSSIPIPVNLSASPSSSAQSQNQNQQQHGQHILSRPAPATNQVDQVPRVQHDLGSNSNSNPAAAAGTLAAKSFEKPLKFIDCFLDKDQEIQELQEEVEKSKKLVRLYKSLIAVKNTRILNMSHHLSDLHENVKIIKTVAALIGLTLPDFIKK